MIYVYRSTRKGYGESERKSLMFWKKKKDQRIPYSVFVALENNEGVIEMCSSREEMMKTYFKYCELIKQSEWLTINDGMIKVSLIKYIKWIEA